jgi:hypothetical protein
MRRLLVRSRLIAALAGITVFAAPAAAYAVGVDNFDDTAPQPFMGIYQSAQTGNVSALSSQTGEFLSLLGPGFCKQETTTQPYPYVDNTAWWKVQGNGRRLSAVAQASSFATMVAVYDSREAVFPAVAPASPTYLDCGFDPQFGHADTVAHWSSVAGRTYWIQAGKCMRAVENADDVPCHQTSSPGPIFSVYVYSDPPANDEQSAPTPLGASATGDNNGATLSAGELSSCGGVVYNKTVWFRQTAADHGRLTVSIDGLSAAVTIMRASDGVVVGCGGTSASARVTRGQDYLIQVGGVGVLSAASEGVFTIGAALVRDSDNDGSLAGTDCDDNDPRRKAAADGGVEKPGNRVDEDCDHVARPFPSIRTEAKLSFLNGNATLKLIGLPARSKLKIRCSHCSKSSLGRSFRHARKRLVLSSGALGRWSRGAVIRVDVTARQRVGHRWKWRMRAVPRSAGECKLVPGLKPKC